MRSNKPDGAATSSGRALTVASHVFEANTIQTVMFDGQPGFVATDVAERLGYAKPDMAISQHCKGPAIYRPLEKAGGAQPHRIILEPDGTPLGFAFGRRLA